MSDILCRWLNHELRLSVTVDPRNYAKDFSNGYLFGEILHKYQMQDDFGLFLKKNTSIAKVNNFSRLEPSFKFLGVVFDKWTAQDLMKEKQGVASSLLNQLYVALEEKKNTGTSQTVESSGAKLHKKKQDFYGCHLPQLVKPCLKQKMTHQMPNDFTVKHTKLLQQPSCSLDFRRKKRQEQLKEKEAQMVRIEMAEFEEKQHKRFNSGFVSLTNYSDQTVPADSSLGGIKQSSEIPPSQKKMILESNSKYIQGIRQRLRESAVAREERQKRVDRFLVEQFKARQAQQEAQLEDQLVRLFTRQTQQEKCLVEQLMQIRRQKEVILQNCLFREQQYQQQRERDFQEAVDREAVLAQRAKLAREEEIKKGLELCKKVAAERAERRHRKHFNMCSDVLGQIVDLATTVGEYHLLTGNLIPERKNKEWKELFLRGLPLYEPIKTTKSLNPSELKKQEVLNNLDYDEYANMFGEWAWPKDAEETKLPTGTNDILAYVVQRLKKIVHPPIVELSTPLFPSFRIKACVLGKFCSGKTTCLAKIAKALGICVLSTETLINEALGTFTEGEEVIEQLHTSPTSVQSDLNKEDEKKECSINLHAAPGPGAVKEMRKGNVISNELIVDILVEAISHVPAQSGWILDGFPHNITQAHMLEKALGGAVDEENEFVSNTFDLPAGPYLPKSSSSPQPVLDLALLLDISDECVVRRAYSHGETATSAAATTSRHTDIMMYSSQTQHRISAFHDTWPELEEWFDEKQKILVRLSAEVEEGEICSTMESVLLQVINKKDEAPASTLVEDALLDSTNSLDTRRSSGQSCSSVKKENDQRHSANVSPTSVCIQGPNGSNVDRPDFASSSPGSVCELYVNEPLPPHVPEQLCSHWDSVCQSYVNNIKQVLQQLRLQLTLVDCHLFNIRKRYNHYLGRPDLTQELVTQWQKDFNSMPDDMREDDETKAELHLRMDELQERLWDIADKRREEDKQERTALMCDRWLEDQATALINHHSMLIQIELNRFRGTLCMLRVYYWNMHRQVPLEPVSRDFKVSLLKITGANDQEDERPSSKKSSSRRAEQSPSDPVKSLQVKLQTDYKQTSQAIRDMVSAEVQQRETKKKQTTNGSSSAKKENQHLRKQKGNDSKKTQNTTENTHDEEIRGKIDKEYTAALTHEKNSANIHLELVKGHGLMMVNSLQSRAQELFDNMEKWFQARYLSEMKCIDQLSEVVRHHIEAGVKLQYQLVLEDGVFYLNGDCRLVQDVSPPPRPIPVEKPNRSILTVIQLESLHCQLSTIAPSGLMSSPDFFIFLGDKISKSLGRNTLPEAWTDLNETQLLEMVSLLTDEYELVDWRRFLLSAALPWPLPSMTQLLNLLQNFRKADADNTGYINKEQYLQTELWFSRENVQKVLEDATEPPPYNRLANLQKFFYQLFAEPFSSPLQLDYVSMLQYFAADPNPRQGFIRALSVVLGQHLQQPSQSLLVKSLPSLEETAELTPFKFTEDYQKEEALFSSCNSFKDPDVSISDLLNVVCHKFAKMQGRIPLPPGCLSQEEHKQNLERVYIELEYSPDESVPFSILSKHPYTLMLMETSTNFQLVNILNAPAPSR